MSLDTTVTYYIKVDEFRYDCFYMDFVFILFSLYDHILKPDQVVSFLIEFHLLFPT